MAVYLDEFILIKRLQGGALLVISRVIITPISGVIHG